MGGTGLGGAGGASVGGGGNSNGGGGSDLCGGTCQGTEACCGQTCVDVKSDKNHCGGCDTACTTNEVCCSGQCRGCCSDNDCLSPDEHCIAGACVVQCTMPKTNCNNVCVLVDSDSTNCGSCGNDCLSGRMCMGGMCQSGWVQMSTANALPPRQRAAATWTGSHLFVWGGENPQGALADGGLYDPKTDTWTLLPMTNAPSARVDAVAITTADNKVLVWGGGPVGSGTALNSGKLFDPATSTWLDVLTAPIGRRNPVAVWSGTYVVLWGGTSGGSAIAGGALYDPSKDKWSVITNANAPSARSNVGWAWSGSELLLFGGRPGGAGMTNDGYGYDPVANSWRKFSTMGVLPSARYDAFAAWTGTLLLVVGGRDAGGTMNDAWLYNPTKDAWAAALDNPLGKRSAPAPRTGWASSGSSQIVVAGGLDETQAMQVNSRVYNASVNDWGAQSLSWPTGADHEYGVGVWTGTEFILWSGLDNSVLTPLGERFRP